MKTLLSFAAVAAVATALAGPAHAAGCNTDKTGATVGGAAVGAAVGGLLGASVAQRGSQGEAAAIGALVGAGLGALAGNQLADDDDCRYDRRYTDPRYGAPVPVYDNRGRGYDPRYGDRRYRDARYDGRRDRSPYSRDYGHYGYGQPAQYGQPAHAYGQVHARPYVQPYSQPPGQVYGPQGPVYGAAASYIRGW